MESEFLYPELADRTSPDTWVQAGSQDILERARTKAREILASHYPDHLDPKLDARIRDRFPVALPRSAMKPGATG